MSRTARVILALVTFAGLAVSLVVVMWIILQRAGNAKDILHAAGYGLFGGVFLLMILRLIPLLKRFAFTT